MFEFRIILQLTLNRGGIDYEVLYLIRTLNVLIILPSINFYYETLNISSTIYLALGFEDRMQSNFSRNVWCNDEEEKQSTDSLVYEKGQKPDTAK